MGPVVPICSSIVKSNGSKLYKKIRGLCFSYVLFRIGGGGGVTENTWNDPTTTTGKKTCAANIDMMDRVYYNTIFILVLLMLYKNFSISETSPCQIDIFLAKSI